MGGPCKKAQQKALSQKNATKQTKMLQLNQLPAGLSRHQFRPKNLCTRLGLVSSAHARNGQLAPFLGQNRLTRPWVGHLLWQQLHLSRKAISQLGTTCKRTCNGRATDAHPGVLVVIHDEPQLAARSQDLPEMLSARKNPKCESPQPAP